MFKKEIEWLIAKGYLKQFVKGYVHIEQDTKKPRQPIQALPEITMILEGTSAGKGTSNRKRKYGKQVLTVSHQQNSWHEPITFTLKDEQE